MESLMGAEVSTEHNPKGPSDHSRDERLAVDETEIVSQLLSDRRGRDHLMLDVGAHFGTSASYFNKLGWSIVCFEPDSNNRERLLARFGGAENVIIDTRAVSDEPALGVSFYSSHESTGISALHAFRDTHSEQGKVDVTTIAEFVRSRDIGSVDFLKIDVEGFDFAVIRGVPWDVLRPDVIECEFEDLKTLRLGHSYHDVAQYLADKGYAVYLSEWHPIVQYGIRHDWRRVVAYPAEGVPADAWGNILAFRNDPGIEAVTRAFDAVIARSVAEVRVGEIWARVAAKPAAAPKPATAPASATAPAPATAPASATAPAPATAPASATAPAPATAPAERPVVPTNKGREAPKRVGRKAVKQPKPARRRTLRARVANWARRTNPLIYRSGQFAMWCLRVARRQVGAVVGLVAVELALITAALLVQSVIWSIGLSAIAILFLTIAATVAVVGYAGHLVRRSATELRRHVDRSIRMVKKRNRKNLASWQTEAAKFRKDVVGLRKDVAGLRNNIEQAKRLLDADARTRLDASVRSSDSKLDRMLTRQNETEAALLARIEVMEKLSSSELDRMSVQQNESEAALLARIAVVEKSSDDTLRALATRQNESEAALLARIADMENSSESTLDRLSVRQDESEATLVARIEFLENSSDGKLDRLSLRQIESDAALLARIEGVENSVLAQIDELGGQARQAVAEAAEGLAAVDQISSQNAKSPVMNIARFQRFDRTLSDADVSDLITKWAVPLGVKASPARLGYLAHRVCLLESQMKGRFATGIETMVLRCLVASAPKRADANLLEIGTLFGIGAAAIYEAAANEYDTAHLTIIDPLDGYYGEEQRDILTGAQISEETLRQNWSLAPIPEDRFTIIKHLSTDADAITEAAKREYDVLVIDGDHSREGVKYDFDNYSGMVRPGGYIILDDYDTEDWPDIKSYVDEEVAHLPNLHLVGTGFRSAVFQIKRRRSTTKRASKE
jgi:FkbM family methyltransferase